MPKITYADAGTTALAEEMRRDPTVFEFCTDATESLLDEFGPVRIRTTPITENTFTGMAVGATGNGYVFCTALDSACASFATLTGSALAATAARNANACCNRMPLSVWSGSSPS